MVATLEDMRSSCGHRYLPYNEARVQDLFDRLVLMADDQGRPSGIRWSPDIAHQITSGQHIGQIPTLKGVPTSCDANLAADTIVFDQ